MRNTTRPRRERATSATARAKTVLTDTTGPVELDMPRDSAETY
jgi:hypothetical protein